MAPPPPSEGNINPPRRSYTVSDFLTMPPFPRSRSIVLALNRRFPSSLQGRGGLLCSATSDPIVSAMLTPLPVRELLIPSRRLSTPSHPRNFASGSPSRSPLPLALSISQHPPSALRLPRIGPLILPSTTRTLSLSISRISTRKRIISSSSLPSRTVPVSPVRPSLRPS